MARRRAGKATIKSASARTRTQQPRPKGGEAGPSLAQRLSVLEREHDALKDELERSRARVRQLEDCHAQVRDRIAWALDSLHNILEGKA
jgi:chromosome segregation ATPase